MFGQHWKRVVKVLLVGSMLMMVGAYVSIYVTLRNRGLREWSQYDSGGFLYDQADRVLRTHDMSTHEFRSRIFAPANFIDRTFFNGPDPIRCLMFDFS